MFLPGAGGRRPILRSRSLRRVVCSVHTAIRAPLNEKQRSRIVRRPVLRWKPNENVVACQLSTLPVLEGQFGHRRLVQIPLVEVDQPSILIVGSLREGKVKADLSSQV